MLVVRIELWPGGDKSRACHMGTAYISNDGTGTVDRGNYDCMLSKWKNPLEAWRSGRVEGFARLTGSPWDLLRLAISAAERGIRANPAKRRAFMRMLRANASGQPSLLDAEVAVQAMAGQSDGSGY